MGTTQIKSNQIAIFKGYSDASVDPILAKGDRVRIEKKQKDGSFIVYALDKTNEDGSPVGDALFEDEFELTGEVAEAPKKGRAKKTDKAVEAVDPAPAVEAPAKKSTKAPAKKAATKTTAKADTKAAGKATTKPAAKKAASKKTAPAVKDAGQEQTHLLDGVTPHPDYVAAAETALSDVSTGPNGATEDEDLPVIHQLSDAALDTGVVIIEDSASVKAILAKSKDAIQAARDLARRSSQNEFALGGVLNHIADTGIWKTVLGKDGQPYQGKRGFTQFIKDNLDIDYRKARYLITIYKTLRRLGKDEKDLEKMGWSKAKEIARLGGVKDEDGNEVGFEFLEDNFDDLAEVAASKSREDLVAEIKKRFAPVSDEKVRETRINVKFIGEAGETVARAIDSAKARTEKGDTASALELIVTEWELYNADLTLDQAIAALQNKYGVTLGVVEDGGSEDKGEVQSVA